MTISLILPIDIERLAGSTVFLPDSNLVVRIMGFIIRIEVKKVLMVLVLVQDGRFPAGIVPEGWPDFSKMWMLF